MEFNKAVALTGVIVTRMDGSGKGGGALSAVAATGAKICFLASGEKPEAFEAYDSQKFVSRLLGFPDLPALLEKAKEATSETNLEKVAEEGKLDYAVFLEQLNAMQKLGPLKQVAQMLGMYEIPKEAMEKNEENFKRFAPMIKSMTAEERKKPELMKQKTRQERVARGAGVGVDEVRQLVGNFEKMQKMFNLMKRDRSLLKRLGKMVPGGLGG
jgi:signal recognition particle subunit SRP54